MDDRTNQVAKGDRLLQYYIGFKITNNFRTRQKLLHQKMSMVENNDKAGTRQKTSQSIHGRTICLG